MEARPVRPFFEAKYDARIANSGVWPSALRHRLRFAEQEHSAENAQSRTACDTGTERHFAYHTFGNESHCFDDRNHRGLFAVFVCIVQSVDNQSAAAADSATCYDPAAADSRGPVGGFGSDDAHYDACLTQSELQLARAAAG